MKDSLKIGIVEETVYDIKWHVR